MEIHQLRYFVATAECGNVSRAASRCRVAQPSLSQQLKKLEDSLGVMLFDRHGRGVTLTDAGRALLPRAKRILGEVKEAEAELLRESEVGVGPVRLGAIPTVAPYILPSTLAQLRQERAECEISIVESFTERLVERVLDHEIDCAVVSTPLAHELLEVEVIAVERLLMAYPAARKMGSEIIRWESLEREPTIVLEEMHCLGRQIGGLCSARHVAPRIVCRTSQLGTVIDLVELGMGISIVPEMVVNYSNHKACSFAPVDWEGAEREIAVIWRRGRTRAVGATRFVEVLRSHFEMGLYRWER